MGRLFVTANTEYLDTSSSPVTGPPFTMCGWVRALSTPASMNAIQLRDSAAGANNHRFTIAFRSTGALRVVARDTSASTADTTNTMGTSEWHHAAATFTSSTNRRIILDGDFPNSGVSTTSRTPDPSNQIQVGVRGTVEGWDGQLAEFGLWNIVLSEEEIIKLSRWRWSPTRIRPQHLVWYRSFRFPDFNHDPPGELPPQLQQPAALLANTGTTFGSHPPHIVYPADRLRFISIASVDPDATTTTVQIQLNALAKPQVQFPAVDQPHSLATGLVGAWLFNSPSRTVTDVIGSVNLALSGTAEWVGRPDGYALRQDETDDFAVASAVHPSLKLGLPITLVAVCYPNGIPDDESTVFGMTHNDSDSDPFQSYAIMLVNRQIKFTGNTGATFFQVLSTENWADHYGERVVVVGTFSRTAVTGYLNGRQIVQSVSARVDPTYSATSNFGTGPVGVSRLRGNDFAAGMVYNRELSPVEITTLSVDPYAAFRPQLSLRTAILAQISAPVGGLFRVGNLDGLGGGGAFFDDPLAG